MTATYDDDIMIKDVHHCSSNQYFQRKDSLERKACDFSFSCVNILYWLHLIFNENESEDQVAEEIFRFLIEKLLMVHPVYLFIFTQLIFTSVFRRIVVH